jgi:hypothetical protein
MPVPDRTAPGRSGSDEYRARRNRATHLAAAAMVAVGLPLVVAVFALWLWLWVRDGGTFGGPGASADDQYEPGAWSPVLISSAWLAAAVLDVAVGRLIYRRAMRVPGKSRGDAG